MARFEIDKAGTKHPLVHFRTSGVPARLGAVPTLVKRALAHYSKIFTLKLSPNQSIAKLTD
jgi:hypothetical protein